MTEYRLYCCGFDFGCADLDSFKAQNDEAARERAWQSIGKYEGETGDTIYREYLYRIEDGAEIEIEV